MQRLFSRRCRTWASPRFAAENDRMREKFKKSPEQKTGGAVKKQNRSSNGWPESARCCSEGAAGISSADTNDDVIKTALINTVAEPRRQQQAGSGCGWQGSGVGVRQRRRLMTSSMHRQRAQRDREWQWRVCGEAVGMGWPPRNLAAPHGLMTSSTEKRFLPLALMQIAAAGGAGGVRSAATAHGAPHRSFFQGVN